MVTLAPFHSQLEEAIARAKAPLCVGLDPDPAKIPDFLGNNIDGLRNFLREIIESTKDLVAAYKPNTAFFEAYGADGWAILEELREWMGNEVLFICDAKRGDVDHTNEAYAEAILQKMGADAITVQPYLGGKPLEPFIRNPEKGMFVLCATSNSGAEAVQNLSVNGRPLYVEIAMQAKSWSSYPNVGLVVGTTKPEALKNIVKVAPELPLLMPGSGSQGGDMSVSLKILNDGGAKGLFNFSRSVLYASADKNFARAARNEVLRLKALFQ